MIMKPFLEKCLARQDLTVDEAAAALDLIMTNQATESQIAGLLIALRAKGETVDEIVGFARTMREHAHRITIADREAIDMCGTGGDGLGTFNISTVATIVVAGAGVTVAKHGNRSVSSRSGSADLLGALGVNLQIPPERVRDCVDTVGVGFLFAPLFHPAMKFAGKPRAELAVRTIFNLLGPLTNPAGVGRQVVGTFSVDVASRLAEALRKLGATKAAVLSSDDGMDEVSTAAGTTIFEVDESGRVSRRHVTVRDFGLPPGPADAARGGSVEENAAIARSVLSGDRSPARDLVIANAALGLVVGGKAQDAREGAALAAESIDAGRASARLKQLIDFTAGG